MPPLLILTFNRPELTMRLIDSLRKIQPTIIFISCDGPRIGRLDDIQNIAKVKRVLSTIDWPCKVSHLYREENYGCEKAVSSAIDWFFRSVNSGIILEDDCLPDPSFFKYCDELLTKYEDCETIMSIGAQHFHGSKYTFSKSYYFSRRVHCWGWATWRRAWEKYDANMMDWPKIRSSTFLQEILPKDWLFNRYWTNIFDLTYSGQINSWAYRWLYSCWRNDGISILPGVNLVTNLGFGDDATHTSKGSKITENLPLQKMIFPLQHPNYIKIDNVADKWAYKKVYEITYFRTLSNLLIEVPGLKKIIRAIKQ